MKSLRPLAVVAVSLIFILTPQIANADEVTINLSPETIYVDTVVEVTAPTEYFIETTNGVRVEVVNGQPRLRDGWIDSWIELRQGETILRADDDSNHINGVNEYASKITGTLDSGTYTIRATSYLNRVANQTPTGTYVLSSNLIQPPPPPPVVEPEPEPEPTPEPTPDPVVEPVPDTTVPTVPDTVVVEPPIIIPMPPEPPLVNEIVAEEPPVPVEEPPAPAEEPPVEAEPAPEEEEQPPVEVDTPPAEEEAPPAEAEEPPTLVEEAPPTVEEAAAEVIAEADGEAVTAEAMEEAGLTYEDLPPETPVEIRTDDNGNAVVITAEVAVALQVLESPAELISAIFENPGQVITAIANIGADMSEEEREESEKVIVASVIAGQAAVNAATMAAGSATRTPSAPSAPAGGPMAGNDKPRAARRRQP